MKIKTPIPGIVVIEKCSTLDGRRFRWYAKRLTVNGDRLVISGYGVPIEIKLSDVVIIKNDHSISKELP